VMSKGQQGSEEAGGRGYGEVWVKGAKVSEVRDGFETVATLKGHFVLMF